jgi:hypothetical protein
MKKFVELYLDTGGKNATQAARMAGYSENGAKVQAHNLLRNPNVLAELRRQLETRMRAGTALAWQTLLELAASGPAPQRLGAAQEILAHAGFIKNKLVTHQHEHVHRLASMSDQELSGHIQRLAEELGVHAPAIDAEFEEVEPKPLPAPSEEPVDMDAEIDRLVAEYQGQDDA